MRNRILIKKNSSKIIIENIALGKENKEIKIKHMNESSSSTIKDLNINSNYFKKRRNCFLIKKNKIFLMKLRLVNKV